MPGKQGVAVVEVTGTIMSEDMVFVLAMVRLGRGIALLPGEVARTVVPRGELVRLFPDYGIGGAMLAAQPSESSPRARGRVNFIPLTPVQAGIQGVDYDRYKCSGSPLSRGRADQLIFV